MHLRGLGVAMAIGVMAGMAACSQGSQHAGATGEAANKPQSADERLKAIYSTEWAWRQQQFADDEDSPQKPVADHLPRVDPAAQKARLEYWEDVQHHLDGIPRTELSAKERINFDIYYPQIQTLIANQRFHDYEMPANSDTTFWTDRSEGTRLNSSHALTSRMPSSA